MKLIWLQSGGCGGCTLSWLGYAHGPLLEVLAEAGIELVWHPSLSAASGDEALALIEAYASGARSFDILCVEGALLRGPWLDQLPSGNFHCFGGGKPMLDWVLRLAMRARHVVAIGSCAAFGGITAAGGNPTDAAGLQHDGEIGGGVLGPYFRDAVGLPVVNVSGCPPHPDWITETLAMLAQGRLTADGLDEFGRPRFFADRLVHHGCPRNEYYEFKAGAEHPGEQGCLMENLGCKGTQAHADCNLRLWNGEGSCLRGGFPCIRCTEPEFEEPGHPFNTTPKVAGIPIGLPADMPKAWFVALAALSKSATPPRVKENATAERLRRAPSVKRSKK
ncbi:MAG: HupU protein [Pseudomonadota bacterium]|uniref:NADH-quinone oxidoreductase subunit B family protein n=1 Tax=Sulfuricystis thermophila TaxID=2496847 RepID=UPI0010368F66|nr:HupU protein [Sulfuricystis thermophila]